MRSRPVGGSCGSAATTVYDIWKSTPIGPINRTAENQWLGKPPHPEPPTCPNCGTELGDMGGGIETGVSLVGEAIEYQRSGCPCCGPTARSERTDAAEDFSLAGV